MFENINKIKLRTGTYDLIVRDLTDAIPGSGSYPWGYIDFEKKQVHLHEPLADNPGLMYQVLFHEAVHEALMSSGVSSYLVENGLDLEETICDSVGFAMAELVAKNPDLVAQLTNDNAQKPLFESARLTRKK